MSNHLHTSPETDQAETQHNRLVEGAINYLDSPIVVVERLADGSLSDPLPSDDSDVSVLQDQMTELRSCFETLPSNEKGLSIGRVEAYRQEMGAAKKSVKLITREDFMKVNKLLGMPYDPIHLVGLFSPALDMTFVIRDPTLEELYGTEYTESLVIHEMAHASSTYSTIEIIRAESHNQPQRIGPASTTMMQPRSGFATLVHGTTYKGRIIEEAYAEFERGRYVAEILGKPAGFFQELPPGSSLEIMNKYCTRFIDNDGNLAGGVSSQTIPAGIFERLIRYDGKLLIALRKARSSLEAMPEVVSRMNAIVPNLYEDLEEMNDTTPDLVKKQLQLFEKVVLATMPKKP